MPTNAGRPASFRPHARFVLPLALAAALAGCTSDSRRLLAEDGSQRTPGAELRYPDVFQPKPKDPPPTLSKDEQDAARNRLRDAAATHKTAAESQIGQ